MGGLELDYIFIKDSFKTNWVVQHVLKVYDYERSLSDYIGEGRFVLTLNPGKAAIHFWMIKFGMSRR